MLVSNMVLIHAGKTDDTIVGMIVIKHQGKCGTLLELTARFNT